uniref:Uncharacterized protein n=1 Tax=Heterorhabditis bacteriophora TaxID=37862 RepID=A0A1I7WNX8_HETBA
MVSFGALGCGPLSRGLCLSAIKGRGFASELFSHIPFFLWASKALRKPLTTSGWTRPELPSGKEE